MEDENKIKKKIYIGLAIVITIFMTIILIVIYNKGQDNRLEKKLKEQKYTKFAGKIYTKDTEKDNYKISYTYSIKSKEFLKTVVNNDQTEIIMLTYKNNQIKINYTNYKPCMINQKGLYKENDFDCKIVKKSNNCSPKCDIMLKYAKEFMKEAKKY